MSEFIGKFSDKEYRIRCHRGEEQEWTTDLSKAKAKKDSYSKPLDLTIKNLFEKFLVECQEKNINVIMVYTPFYIEGQKYIKNHEEIILYYQNISDKLGIQLLNYLDNDLCRDKEYFYNAMHLNKKGSQLFTKMLIEDIRIPTQNILHN
jgi:hypothetical protein